MPRKVTTKQIQQDLRTLVLEDIRTAFRGVGKVVERAGRGGSALNGLEITATAFAAVLDAYANPNAENPQGMCDDPKAFRRHFAEIVARGADTPPSQSPSDDADDREVRPKKEGNHAR